MSYSGLKEDAMYGAISAGISGALGATVGYRIAGGTAPDKALPSVGPVPADLLVTGAGAIVAIMSKDTKIAKTGLAAAVGSACFFTATAGQSVGKKIKEKMKGAKGVPTLTSKKELEDFMQNLREKEAAAA